MRTDDNPCIDFGIRLRTIRVQRGLSQERLAQVAELDRTYISSCEAGRRNVTLKTLFRLAEALDVDPAVFIAQGASMAAEDLAAWGEKRTD